jgi:hypothetical protein
MLVMFVLRRNDRRRASRRPHPSSRSGRRLAISRITLPRVLPLLRAPNTSDCLSIYFHPRENDFNTTWIYTAVQANNMPIRPAPTCCFEFAVDRSVCVCHFASSEYGPSAEFAILYTSAIPRATILSPNVSSYLHSGESLRLLHCF